MIIYPPDWFVIKGYTLNLRSLDYVYGPISALTEEHMRSSLYEPL